MKEIIDILWFRRDIRIDNNELLSQNYDKKVLLIFIFEKHLYSNKNKLFFLKQHIQNFKKELLKNKYNIALFSGNASEIFEYLSNSYIINNIYTNFENYSIDEELEKIKKKWKIITYDHSFLIPTDKILKNDGTPYKVFTPYFNSSLQYLNKNFRFDKLAINTHINLVDYDYNHLIEIENNNVWKIKIEDFFNKDKNIRLPHDYFLSKGSLFKRVLDSLAKYDTNRNYPSLYNKTYLSIYLRYGIISIKELCNILINNENGFSMIRELIWREFFRYIMFHFPKTEKEEFNSNSIRWENNPEYFERWSKGETGIPIIDAGIRQLITENYMHNRVRMICASFLTKNLLCDYRKGEEFFAKHLLDYEKSSNIGNWQWVAGTGTDTKSLFRIFNPYIQTKKFDFNGEYIKKYIPELSNIDSKVFYNEDKLTKLNLTNYPAPMINYKYSVDYYRLNR